MKVDEEKVVITQRDHELFFFLNQGKVSTVEQINRYFFPDTGFKTVHRRLTKLVKTNFLSKDVFLQNGSPKITFGLGEKGLSRIQSLLPYAAPPKVQKSDSPEHDIVLNDIRYALKRSDRVLSILGENELQSSQEFQKDKRYAPFVELNSDGVLSIKKSSGDILVALEYDANKKTASRYLEKMQQYYRKTVIPAVFYIGKTKSILSMVQNAERLVREDTGKKYKFFYGLLENVLAGKGEINFESLSGRRFKF